VSRALTAQGWNVSSAFLGWRPKNPVSLSGAARAEVEAFLAALDDDDDVQRIFAGLADG
jgi:transcriptional/translational regulatory protein YebC/TACO1